MISAFARLDGHPVGIVASQPKFLAGAMGPDGCDKCAQFIALCVRVGGSFLWFEGSAAAGVVDRITLLGMFAVTHALPFFLYAPVLLKRGLGDPVASAPVGRNEPCPCGSGKKYKKCCGSPVEAR